MQDSLGGNAKTLMFVNISPSSFNLDETLMSCTFANRVKQVTNGATRNAESKEVARLKNVRCRQTVVITYSPNIKSVRVTFYP